jgi:hypothetical protein
MTTRRVTNKYGIVLVQKIRESKHANKMYYSLGWVEAKEGDKAEMMMDLIPVSRALA